MALNTNSSVALGYSSRCLWSPVNCASNFRGAESGGPRPLPVVPSPSDTLRQRGFSQGLVLEVT